MSIAAKIIVMRQGTDMWNGLFFSNDGFNNDGFNSVEANRAARFMPFRKFSSMASLKRFP